MSLNTLIQSWASKFCLTVICLGICGTSLVFADETAIAPKAKEVTKGGTPPVKGEASADASSDSAASAAAAAAVKAAESPAVKPKYPPFASIVKDAKPIPGLMTLYRRESQLFAEISPSLLNRDLILVMSIAKGIGVNPVVGGMSWGGFGDDGIFQFKKVDDTIRIVRRNVRFTATKGTPEDKALDLAYTDSVMFSQPILTVSPSGAPVIDLTPVFMSDFAEISTELRGFMFSPSKSNWAMTKSYSDNVEIEVAATYVSSGSQKIDTVADSRAVTINVHYSLSLLPQTGYKPRLADDRVGYFLTVVKDYSHKKDQDRFIRYINRWDLQKIDPSLETSPPKKPIVFWLEKTIPFKYRKPIRDGIEEWNKAYKLAGFHDAIEVRQQPDNADWDPEDLNYNTFRWITSSIGYAMGPSRTNPLTGQILDADIIFDSDFLLSWNMEHENFTPKSIAEMTGGPLDMRGYRELLRFQNGKHFCGRDCALSHGRSSEFAFGNAMFLAKHPLVSEVEKEKMVMQGLKEIAMHESGHTLGLRHNFRSSYLYNLKDLNDPEKTKDTGITSSVMDYTPTNIAPKGEKQGDYFSQTIGPYDYWAIEYGYKPISAGSPEGELPELKKIASKSGDPKLAYSTDEDTTGISPDPASNRFDLGDDPIAYAKQRAKLIGDLWPGLVDRMVKDGEGYQEAKKTFNILLTKYGQAMFFVSREIGGIHTSRTHKGDKGGVAPYVVVEAKKQREAMKLLEENVFSDKPFQFPPALYNYLASSNWNHWGTKFSPRGDLPIHQSIIAWQERILTKLTNDLTLERLYDSELRVPSDEDAFTVPELFRSLTGIIFKEVEKGKDGEFTERKPAISSLRRNLQRKYLERLSEIALGKSDAPTDCRSVTQLVLKELMEKTNKFVEDNPKIDTYSKAHLQESSAYIKKVLDANVQIGAGDSGLGFLFHAFGKEAAEPVEAK